ncbi:MAG: hypothetical protein QM612_10035 [Thermomonas sp.]
MTEPFWSRRELLAMMAAGTATALLPRAVRADAPPSSLLLRDVRVIDGTGAPARAADVLVQGERIVRIGKVSPRLVPGARTIEGGSRVLAPGFIDLHTHGDPLERTYASHLAMGVTTVLLGQDGSSPGADEEGQRRLSHWFDAAQRAQPDINVATCSGHGSLRRQAGIDDATRTPTDAQIARLAQVLEEDILAGSFGLSTGLEYVPGLYAEPREIAALGPVVARHDGVCMSHLRTEDDDRIDSAIREHIEASRPARTHISHLKVTLGRGEARAERLLASLRAYRNAGVPLTADAYPYAASFTTIAILFPEWALPPTDYAQVLAARRDELLQALERNMIRRRGPDALLFGTGPFTGKTLAQAAQETGKPFAQVLLDLGPGGASAAHFSHGRTAAGAADARPVRGHRQRRFADQPASARPRHLRQVDRGVRGAQPSGDAGGSRAQGHRIAGIDPAPARPRHPSRRRGGRPDPVRPAERPRTRRLRQPVHARRRLRSGAAGRRTCIRER